MLRILLPFMLAYFTSCQNDLESVRQKFGTDQNPERKKLYLNPVADNMEIEEDISVEGRRYIFINQKEASINSPAYTRKIILLDSMRASIMVEQDYFKNAQEGKELIVEHRYDLRKTAVGLQAPEGNREIVIPEADSVLQAWNIKENPFSVRN